jgi:hypothetical protein
MLCELLDPRQPDIARALVPDVVTDELNSVAVAAGMIPIGHRALDAIRGGRTSPPEVRRILGHWRIDEPANSPHQDRRP